MNKMRRVLFAILALLAMHTATANNCQSSTTVITTAVGSQATTTSSMSDAVQATLNQALSAVRGIYITSTSTLSDEFWESTGAGGSDWGIASSLSQEIENRFSGFIESYEIIETKQYGDGIVEVTASVSVCLDERIAIVLSQDPVSSRILNGLIDYIWAAGWVITYDQPKPNASDTDLASFAMRTGVSYIATGDVHSHTAMNRESMYTTTATLSMNLINTATLQLAHSFSVTHNGVGTTRESAEIMASNQIAADLARSWNIAFLQPHQKQVADLRFEDVNRAGTRYSLVDIVKVVPGVLSVLSSDYDPTTRMATLRIEHSGNLCDIAYEIPNYRRVITSLLSCSGNQAALQVIGD